MIYPKFIKKNDSIGVTAPSDSCLETIDKERLDNAKNNLKKYNINIIETSSVRKEVSTNKKIKELEEQFTSNKIKAVISASGGDYLKRIINQINFEKIKTNPKWFIGYSDNTYLTYLITTKLDIATIYGDNFKSYGMKKLDKSLIDQIKLLKGKKLKFKSYKLFEKERKPKETGLETYNLTEKVNWIVDKKIIEKGRLIGGCIDVLKDIIETGLDETNNFIEKYKQDNIIWYFENYSLDSNELKDFFDLLNKKNYFKYTKCIIFGRSLTSETDRKYYKTIKEYFKSKKINLIIDTDIGHLSPRIPIINGAYVKIKVNNNKGKIKYYLK